MVTIGDLLAAANVALLLFLAALSWRARRRRDRSWLWLRPLFVGMCLYWAGVYLFVLVVAPEDYNQALFEQTLIRPAFTLTLALMAAHALLRAD